MADKAASRPSPWRRALCWIVFGVALGALCAPPANAVDWQKGKWLIQWDNTVTYGVQFRLEDQDPRLIGLANGAFVSDASAFSVNGDDGNLNYDTGIFSNLVNLTTELEISRGDNFGLFFRARGFYDYENENGDRARTPLSDAALKRVGSRVDVLDAYARIGFRIGRKPAEIRAGLQNLSWGESTFIPGGLNIINPVDVSALREPGAELRNALLPVAAVWGSFTLTDNLNVDGFYQFDWEPVYIDPPGTYFSTNDFAGQGGETVFLAFGSVGDTPPFSDPFETDRPFLGVPREATQEASDSGQYGLALRWFVPQLGGTEFGFYYINYHSRVPTINGRTGTVAGAQMAGTIGAATPTIAQATLVYLGGNPGDIQGAIAAGTLAGIQAGATPGSSAAIAATTATTGGDMTAIGQTATAFATDAYSRTARYFTAYPEDLQVYGISYNSQIGTTGLALQGELSFRPNAPVQVDDVELLFAALEPINPVFAGLASSDPDDPTAGASQLTTYNCPDGVFPCDYNYVNQFETPVSGIIEENRWQFQTTATKIWSRALGADQLMLLLEGGVVYYPDLPGPGELRIEGPGTYTSGNPYHEDPTNAGAAHGLKPAEDWEHFGDATSWGYVLLARAEYFNVFGAWGLAPRISFSHDVNGNTPGPGGPFVEGSMRYNVGLDFNYQNTMSVGLAWTGFAGASRYNLLSDRDFVAANFKYAF